MCQTLQRMVCFGEQGMIQNAPTQAAVVGGCENKGSRLAACISSSNTTGTMSNGIVFQFYKSAKTKQSQSSSIHEKKH